MGGLHLCGVVAGTMVTRDCHMFNTQNTKYRWCVKESQQLRQSVSHSNTHYWIIAECSHLASTLIYTCADLVAKYWYGQFWAHLQLPVAGDKLTSTFIDQIPRQNWSLLTVLQGTNIRLHCYDPPPPPVVRGKTLLIFIEGGREVLNKW